MKWQFGPFLFDSETLELTKFDLKLRLEEKPARLLVHLLQRQGRIVTREELRNCLWEQGVNLDFDHGLNKALCKLRSTLGDDSTRPQYLETLRGRGYRFIGKVSLSDRESPVSSPTENTSEASALSTEMESNRLLDSDEPNSLANILTKFLLLSRVRYGTTKQKSATIILLALVLLLVSTKLANWNHASAARPLRATITVPTGMRLITRGENAGIALSPDGTRIAFSAIGSDGHTNLWIRRLDTLIPEPVAGTEGGGFPFWSPNGLNLGYFTDLELRRVDLVSHSTVTLCHADSGRGGTWSNSGDILFTTGTRKPIYRISDSGGSPVPVTTLDESRYTSHRWPAFLPDGKHFVYLAVNHSPGSSPSAIYLSSLEDGQSRWLAEADSNVIPVGDSLLYLSHGKLIHQPLNLQTGKLDVQARIVAEAVEYDPGLWYGTFTGNLSSVLYSPRSESQESETISWFDTNGNRLNDQGPAGIYRGVNLAPDGKSIAISCGDPDTNICLTHPDGSVTYLTHSGSNSGPIWATNSSAIVYTSHRGPQNWTIFLKSLDAAAPQQVLLESSVPISALSLHSDNQRLLLVREVPGSQTQFLVFDLKTGKLDTFLPNESGLLGFARFSPDGNWVAYQIRMKEHYEIRIASFPIPSQSFRIPIPARAAMWRSDGQELYLLASDEYLYSVPISKRPQGLHFGAPRRLFRPPIFPPPWDTSSVDVSPDGKKFVINRLDSIAAPELVLATNWQAFPAQ